MRSIKERAKEKEVVYYKKLQYFGEMNIQVNIRCYDG
jgi:hypothetical protein